VSPRALARLLAVYLAVLVVACLAVNRAMALRDVDGETVASGWRHGQLVTRVVGRDPPAFIPGAVEVREQVVGEGPLPFTSEMILAMSLVTARDGVKATLGDKTAYVTPDDLLAREGYDKGITIPSLSLSIGADVPLIEALLAERLGASVPDVVAKATLRRIRTKRTVVEMLGVVPTPYAAVTPEQVTPELLRTAAVDAARFLASGITDDGHFRYMVDAPTNKSLPGYDWPRHAGATFFLAQAAELTGDARLKDAALRAASLLRDKTMSTCGANKCVGDADVVDVGSSALALIAFHQIARAGLDASYRANVDDLARFLRAQQRPDGEFMHWFDRRTNAPVDVQLLYYSGEATLALARAYALGNDPANLDAAKRGLAHLVGPAWSFFGDRYYFGEEHWTCQAMSELWEKSPDAKALDFCTRWQAYGRHMMFGPGETPYDADGAYGVGPVVTPRLTPVASRCEAGVATLDAMNRANASSSERDALAGQLRRSLALLLRQQLRPGFAHLFADARAVYGAFPGSQVDWQLRIDYAQHAGSAMLRAADLLGPKPP
jgi:hypothetical protein